MRTFIERALQKLPKLTSEQITALLLSVAAENERLESVIDSLPEGLLVCDAENNLILVNKSAERLLPLVPREQGETPLWLAIGDDRLAEFLHTSLEQGDRVDEKEFDLEVKGIHRLVAISLLPLVSDRRVTGSVIHVDDITEKRGKEARLRRAENLASLTTLAAGVAHEIKNPLGSMSIHIQLIQKALASSCASKDILEKYLGVVTEEIDRLNGIVVDFLFAVRPMDMDLREGDLNALVRELIEFTHYELSQTGINCELHLADNLAKLKFDERYIKQALLNLVKNAQAAMPEGGTLSVSTELSGDEVKLTVADTGVGISEENLSKIFEPYFTTKDTGSGLGLTLVFKIVKEHRGEISVKSREGEGTRFTITLPVPQKERKLISWEGAEP